MAEVERKSKGIDAPKCKVCGKRHWGVCSDQSSGGYLSAVSRPAQTPATTRLAAAKKALSKAGKGKRK